MNNTPRENLIVCGRLIGTCQGWDQDDLLVLTYYAFEPAAGLTLPNGDLMIDCEDGVLTVYPPADNELPAEFCDAPLFTGDLILTIKDLPIVEYTA